MDRLRAMEINIPNFISTLAYRPRIESQCQALNSIGGIKYYVMVIKFFNGRNYILSNMFDYAVPYYGEGYIRADNSFSDDLIANRDHYLARDFLDSTQAKVDIIMQDLYSICRTYYIVRHFDEGKIIFGALHDKIIENVTRFYEVTIKPFEKFCLAFLTNNLDIVKKDNLDFKFSRLFTDAHYREKVIKDHLFSAGQLSKRETECLLWIAMGKSTDETAVIMDIKPSTVDTYRKNIVRKLNVTNMYAAVFEATRRGILDKEIWETLC